jgi:hypothetical protein
MFDGIGSKRITYLDATHFDLHVGPVLRHIADDDVAVGNGNIGKDSDEPNVSLPHDLGRNSLAGRVLDSGESVVVQVCVKYPTLRASLVIDS